ncbi:hypothetical protein PVAND_007814 [Polypedilum vanderplanki]|uniref:DUF4774 domain-containing protein n=1 Tax=Polypedilum vanderplanki TaxID=319348 RepID=A0A9J6C7V1_POLVA|nr:hypothetical protein PVAND_007814 [Polypedilum vanderplanki]
MLAAQSYRFKLLSFIFEEVDDSVRLPYIGGAKGQVLEIRQRPDGTIFSRILMDDLKKEEDKSIIDIATIRKKEENSFENNLLAIQQAAADLVAIQEAFKENGELTNEQRKKYSQSLEKLGVSAQKLANIQDDEDSLRLLLEDSKESKKKTDTRKKPQALFPPFNNNNSNKEKEENCEEIGLVGEEGVDSTTISSVSSISSVEVATTKSTTLKSTTTTTTKKPPIIVSSSQTAIANDSNDDGDEESSVAEAKPVGLAIAGIGGVASSKPVGTAVVGPGGLAVARPVATAIAGLKPSDISSLGLPLPAKLKNLSSRGNAIVPTKGKYGLVHLGSEDDETEILVGPDFLAEARLSDKGIDSSDDDEFDNDDKVETDAQEIDGSKQPIVVLTNNGSEKEKDEINGIDSNKQVEPVESHQFPYGINFNKLPQFPPTFEHALGYQLPNPFFLPPNSYVVNPIPIANQYLQRRATLRYPPFISLYPSLYGQNTANSAPISYSPYRLFYAPQ